MANDRNFIRDHGGLIPVYVAAAVVAVAIALIFLEHCWYRRRPRNANPAIDTTCGSKPPQVHKLPSGSYGTMNKR